MGVRWESAVPEVCRQKAGDNSYITPGSKRSQRANVPRHSSPVAPSRRGLPQPGIAGTKRISHRWNTARRRRNQGGAATEETQIDTDGSKEMRRDSAGSGCRKIVAACDELRGVLGIGTDGRKGKPQQCGPQMFSSLLLVLEALTRPPDMPRSSLLSPILQNSRTTNAAILRQPRRLSRSMNHG